MKGVIGTVLALVLAFLVSPAPASAQNAALTDAADPRCAVPEGFGAGTRLSSSDIEEANRTFHADMIFVDYSDAEADRPVAEYRDRVVPSSLEILERVSYGQYELTVDIHPEWIRMPNPSSDYGSGQNQPFDFESFFRDAAMAADQTVDFAGSDAIYVMVPETASNHFGVNTAHNGGPVVEVDGTTISQWTQYDQFQMLSGGAPSVVAHETLHLHGLPDLYGRPADAPASTGFIDAAGSWDLMSRGGPRPELFSWQKLMLEWIQPADVLCMAEAGTVEVELEALESAAGTRAVVLPLDEAEQRRIVLEYRSVERAPGNNSCQSGVLAYTVAPFGQSGTGPHVVFDQEPGTPDGAAWPCEHQLDDAVFGPGDGLIDLGHGFTAEVTSMDDQSAQLRIERGDTIAAAQEGLVDGDPATVDRIGEEGAIPNAIAVSQGRFEDAAAAHVVLSRDDAFPDSLAGTALLGDGPLLLTGTDTLDERTATEIDRVLADGSGIVYLLGGTSALSDAVETVLQSRGHFTARLAGPSRVETSLVIAEEVARLYGGSEVIIARANAAQGNPTSGWADSVTAGGYAAAEGVPVVLSASDGLSPQLDGFVSSRFVAHVIGGTAALSDRVLADVAQLVPDAARVAGPARDATAAAIRSTLWGAQGLGTTVLINGFEDIGWAYGLPAAGLSADLGAPMLPVSSTSVPPSTMEALTSCGVKGTELLVAAPESLIPTFVGEEAESVDGSC